MLRPSWHSLQRARERHFTPNPSRTFCHPGKIACRHWQSYTSQWRRWYAGHWRWQCRRRIYSGGRAIKYSNARSDGHSFNRPSCRMGKRKRYYFDIASTPQRERRNQPHFGILRAGRCNIKRNGQACYCQYGNRAWRDLKRFPIRWRNPALFGRKRARAWLCCPRRRWWRRLWPSWFHWSIDNRSDDCASLKPR